MNTFKGLTIYALIIVLVMLGVAVKHNLDNGKDWRGRTPNIIIEGETE